MSQHTPGPWFLLNEHCVGGPVEPGWEAAGSGIAHCGMRARTVEEAAANARLIAAAPTLKEALARWVKLAEDAIREMGVTPHPDELAVLNQARAALTLATNGAPGE